MPGYIDRAANKVADILMREGLDYTQTKAVFKQARAKAGLHAPKARRGSPARLNLEEELRLIDKAYAHGGQVGLMMQVLLETGTRVWEFVALRVEDVSLAERAIVIEDGKGGKRREVPMRAELVRLVALHVGRRRSGPLFVSRQRRSDVRPPAFTRQRIGQIVRQIARGADIGKRIYAETSVAMLRRKFDRVTDQTGRDLVQRISQDHGEVVGAFAADLMAEPSGADI